MRPIFQDVFDNWDAAVAYQRIALEHYLAAGIPIRACEIVDEMSFRTGTRVYKVFVRPFIVAQNATL